MANGIEAAKVQHVTELSRVREHAFRWGCPRLIEMGHIRLRRSEVRCVEMRNEAATPFPRRF
ncbi:hypothetical protein CBM2626_A220054 [Cupriavidus taiwanensis]|nr:hypothetical protein CBM2626_A220054 [Cupriavidus taiwanensis]